MSRNSFFARFLRFLGILLMSLTAGFTILGGAGTSCAAFNPTNPDWVDSMGPLAQMQWLYILYVFVTVAIGLAGVRAVVLLIKGDAKAYREALIALVAGVVIGVFHIATSRLLRGKSMPVDMVVYITVLTLIVFLLFRLPGLWQGVNFDKSPGNPTLSGGAAAIVMGLLCLAIPTIAGTTHTWKTVNYAEAFHASLTPLGWLLILGGLAALLTYGLAPISLKTKTVQLARGK